MLGITCKHYEAYVTFILGFVTCSLGDLTASQRDRTFQNCFCASIAIGRRKNVVVLELGNFGLLFFIAWRN